MIQLFYSVAATNALFSSMAWCVAKPNRLPILALLTFAVIWPFVNGDLEGDVLLTLGPGRGDRAHSGDWIRAAVRRNHPAEHGALRKNAEQFTTRRIGLRILIRRQVGGPTRACSSSALNQVSSKAPPAPKLLE